MEYLTIGLIVIIAILSIIIVFMFVKSKKNNSNPPKLGAAPPKLGAAPPSLPTCVSYPCPTCPTDVSTSLGDIINMLKELERLKKDSFISMFEGFTIQQIVSAASDPVNRFFLLPQNIQKMSVEQLKNRTPMQLIICNLAFIAFMKKINFSYEQLKAMTPQEISQIVTYSTQIMYPVAIEIEGTQGALDESQLNAIYNIIYNIK